MFGKDSKKKELIKKLDKLYEQIQREQKISPGDFPDLEIMRERLQHQDFTKFKPLDAKLLANVDKMLAEDISKLMTMIPTEEMQARQEGKDHIEGGAFDGVLGKSTPFMFQGGEGINAGVGELEWVVDKERSQYDEIFDTLNPVNGKISGAAARQEMIKSKLPNNVMGKIWKLSDVDKDGKLDADEFALAMYLITIKKDGHDLPSELPAHLVPPSKRSRF